MEERPSERAHEKRYHHGGERSPSRTKTSLKNDPSQCQHQETQTKKTGNGKVNGCAVERKYTALSASESVGIAYSASGNGHQSQLDSSWKRKQPGRAHSGISKPGSRGGLGYRNGVMDGRNDRTPDLLAHEGKKELTTLPNGVSVPLGPSFFANGYPSDKKAVGPDNEGSGSESSCATPKKRKPLRNTGSKGAEPGTPEPHTPEQMEKPAGPATNVETRANMLASVSVATAIPMAMPTPPTATCELQRKNFDTKAIGAFSKKQDDRLSKAKANPNITAAVREKEDSWTLFKPPPVFPVDNSSAKIVPKISYASKVKENLNKAGGEALASSGAQLAPAPGRPSLVPMSAMKTITSSSFANGALCSGEGNGYSLSGTLFACTVPPENVAPPADEGGGVLITPSSPALVVGEPRKPSLFVHPLAPSSSNMQLALPSGRQSDLPTSSPSPAPGPDPSSTNQKALGDIFQNQWGLSFINDPSAGPEGSVAGVGEELVSRKGKVAEVTFQGDCPIPLSAPHVVSEAASLQSKTHKSEKRTSPQTHCSVLKAGPPPAPPPLRDSTAQMCGLDGQEDAAEAQNLGAIVFASPKDPPTLGEPLRASSTNVVSSPQPRVSTHPKGMDMRCSWGWFDLKAAVNYHTKEMEHILNLQKQDPRRVVHYGRTKDGPKQ